MALSALCDHLCSNVLPLHLQLTNFHCSLPAAKACDMLSRDGESNNLSWNCGEEGETNSPSVLRLRSRQIRNMAAALLLSHGVPMIQMGDEYGHTKVWSANVFTSWQATQSCACLDTLLAACNL